MENSDYKEKRKNDAYKTQRITAYRLLAIMGLVVGMHLLGYLLVAFSIYPLIIMIHSILSIISFPLYSLSIFWGGGVFLFACFIPGFEALERLAYIGIISVLGLFIFFMSFAAIFNNYNHNDMITFNGQIYYLAHNYDMDYSRYHLFVCNTTGIICIEQKELSGGTYNHLELEISTDNNSIEVRSYEGDLFYTYTPETAGTE